jgi:hypothetical protein
MLEIVVFEFLRYQISIALGQIPKEF